MFLGRAALIAGALAASLAAALPQRASAQQPPGESRAIPADALREALARSRASGDSAAMAEALNAIGLQYWNVARFDSAAFYLHQALAVWSALGDSAGLGRVYNNLGVTYYQWGDLPAALDALIRSMAVRRARGDLRGAALALTNIGRAYRDWRLFERGRAALDEAVRLGDESGDAFVRAYSRYNLGLLLLARNDAEGARAAFEEALRLYTELGSSLTSSQAHDGVAMNREALARVQLLTGDFRPAVRALEEILGRAGARATSGRKTEALVALGRGYLASGASGEALATFERALALARESGQRRRALQAIEGLSAAYEQRGDLREALAHARLHRALMDSLAAEEGLRAADAAEHRFEIEREAAEGQLLRELRRRNEAVIARQRAGFVLGGFLLLVSTTILVVFARLRRLGKERERLLRGANDALEKANQDLRAALSSVRTLEGLIPICARCKKVRDESGYWESVESYIASRSEALFSHGLCDACGKDLYGDAWIEEPALTAPAPGEPAPPPAREY